MNEHDAVQRQIHLTRDNNCIRVSKQMSDIKNIEELLRKWEHFKELITSTKDRKLTDKELALDAQMSKLSEISHLKKQHDND